MEIEVKTTYDEKAMRALVSASTFHSHPVLFFALSAIAALLIIGGTILELILSGVVNMWLFLAAVASVVVLINFIMIYVRLPKKSAEAFEKSGQKFPVFTLRDEEFTVTVTGTGARGETTYLYTNLCKVIENNSYFLLFVTKNSACVVDKSSLSAEDADAIRSALVRAVGQKKIKVRK